MTERYDAVVVGGGILGLSTAWWLLRRGAHVALIERHLLGHDRGSSHGRSRITRSAYADPLYARMAAAAHVEAWPTLAADLGLRLLHPRDGCFFGWADGLIGAYATAVAEAGADVARLDPAEAARRFPMFRFGQDVTALWDRTAAVVAAADTMAGLAAWVRARATVWEGCAVHGLDADAPAVHTDRGVLSAERVIVTAGAWTGALVPSLRATLTPIRQTVLYLDVDADPDAFPVWVWKGRTEDEMFYGLPRFQRPGLKIARHVLDGRRDDPDAPAGPPEIDAVLAFARERLRVPVRGVLATERCLYTVAPREDFVLDALPDAPHVIVGSACSGHGFKLAPLNGRILAELALDGRSTVAPFVTSRARFALPRA